MTCEELEPLLERLVDGDTALSDAAKTHFESCASCHSRRELARNIDGLLAVRDVAVAPTTFTAAVMARAGRERWQVEQVVDLGFNLAIAAGVLFILAGAAGLAWSLGFLRVTADIEVLLSLTRTQLSIGIAASQLQSFVLAAVILTITLVLWWWVEADSAY